MGRKLHNTAETSELSETEVSKVGIHYIAPSSLAKGTPRYFQLWLGLVEVAEDSPPRKSKQEWQSWI